MKVNRVLSIQYEAIKLDRYKWKSATKKMAVIDPTAHSMSVYNNSEEKLELSWVKPTQNDNQLKIKNIIAPKENMLISFELFPDDKWGESELFLRGIPSKGMIHITFYC